jgi:cyclase
MVYTHSGRLSTGANVFETLSRISQLSFGELLIQSIDREGTFAGMDNSVIYELKKLFNVPIIMSGGFGDPQHALEVALSKASGVSIGSAFQFRPITPAQIREKLKENSIDVR